jgi:hypothetical protein
MKKVVLSMALVAMMSVSFVSCKDKAADAPAEEPAVEAEAPATEEPAAAPADSAAMPADSAAAATPAPAAAPAH